MRIDALAAAPRLLLSYLAAALAPVAVTFVVLPFRLFIDLSNVALLHVLAVVLIGTRFGRGPAVLAAILAALLFAYVFVPPHFSLAITETQYLITAIIMLVVALLVGHMTAKLKQHIDRLDLRSRRSRLLYEFSQALSAARDSASAVAATGHFLSDALNAERISVIFPEHFAAPPEPANPAIIATCVERGELCTKPTGPGRIYALLPLSATAGNQGVLGFEVAVDVLGDEDSVEFVVTLASVISVAIERSRFAELARETEVKHAAESLRSSILGALSHDLRTPLAALVSMADTAALNKASPERQKHLLESIRNQTLSISQQMTNLLDMARLSSGRVELNLAWQPVDEVVGSVMQLIRSQWRDREISVDIARDLPPVRIDAVLIERVLWNLMENAIKYSPADTMIELAIRRQDAWLELAVSDSGIGLPVGDSKLLFNVFHRGQQESDIAGVGLGLSIARTIVEAHGGEIVAANRRGGGACFRVRLPLETPPDAAFGELE